MLTKDWWTGQLHRPTALCCTAWSFTCRTCMSTFVIMNGHSSSHFGHLDSWELVKFFKVKKCTVFIVVTDWSMICNYKGFTLNLAHLWFPFVMSSMRKVELVPRVFIVLIASSSLVTCFVLLGFPAAPRVWMKLWEHWCCKGFFNLMTSVDLEKWNHDVQVQTPSEQWLL